MKWTDTREIGETSPTNSRTWTRSRLSFVKMHEMICALPRFRRRPGREQREDSRSDPDGVVGRTGLTDETEVTDGGALQGFLENRKEKGGERLLTSFRLVGIGGDGGREDVRHGRGITRTSSLGRRFTPKKDHVDVKGSSRGRKGSSGSGAAHDRHNVDKITAMQEYPYSRYKVL